jgi:hypothetical protein
MLEMALNRKKKASKSSVVMTFQRFNPATVSYAKNWVTELTGYATWTTTF